MTSEIRVISSQECFGRDLFGFLSIHGERHINDASVEQASSSNCSYIAASSVLGAFVNSEQPGHHPNVEKVKLHKSFAESQSQTALCECCIRCRFKLPTT